MMKSPLWLIILFVSLVFFLPVSSQSQDLVSTLSVNQVYRIPYRPGEYNIYGYGNAIIKEIAKDVLRQPWLVKLDVIYSSGLTVEHGNATPVMKLRFFDPVIRGDLNYRTFPIGDLLLPDRSTFKIRWANRLDTTSFTETHFSNQPLIFGDTCTISEPVTAFDPEVDTLMVKDVVFHYDSLALERFMQRLWLINDYYASVAILDSLALFSAGIGLSETATLPMDFMQVMEFDKIIACIDSRNFPTGLLAAGYDPKELQRKFIPMFKHARSISFTFRDQLQSCGAITWDEDIDRLAEYFTGRILSYVQRAQLMNGIHGKIYQNYLDNWFSSNVFGDDYSILETMLAKMYPDALRDTLVDFVSKHILLSYQQRSLNLMAEGRFADAFSLMENGVRFKKSNPHLKNGNGTDAILIKAANGIYSSYASIADACLDAGKMEMAGEYLEKACQYRKERSDYINSDSIYNIVFSRLFFIRNADCDRLLAAHQYDDALGCYHALEQAYDQQHLRSIRHDLDDKISRARQGILESMVENSERLLATNSGDSAALLFRDAVALSGTFNPNRQAIQKLDSLAPQMAAIQYSALFQSGTSAFLHRQFTLAMKLYEEAKALSMKYNMAEDPEMDSLYRQAVKQSLLIKLASNRKVIWSSQFDSARAFLARVETTAKANNLISDVDLIAAMAKYREKMGEQLCRNLGDSIEVRLIRADRLISGRNFTRAMDILKEAVSLSVSRSECRYPVGPLLDTIAKYTQAATYQRKRSDAELHAAAGAYNLVIPELENAATLYKENNLVKFGLEPPDVFAYLEQRGNPLLTEYAVNYHVAKSDYQSAMEFMHLMKRQNYPEKGASAIQIQLGKRLAMEDFRKNLGDSVSVKLNIYTENQSWYREFSDAYKGEWNRLVKMNNPR